MVTGRTSSLDDGHVSVRVQRLLHTHPSLHSSAVRRAASLSATSRNDDRQGLSFQLASQVFDFSLISARSTMMDRNRLFIGGVVRVLSGLPLAVDLHEPRHVSRVRDQSIRWKAVEENTWRALHEQVCCFFAEFQPYCLHVQSTDSSCLFGGFRFLGGGGGVGGRPNDYLQ